MPLLPPLEPLADNADPWVQVVVKLAEKIQNTTLSFHKYLIAQGYQAPKIFTRFGLSAKEPMLNVTRDQWPAVVLDAYNTDFVEDHGAGDERWFWSVALRFMVEIQARDARVATRATHELIRTIFHKYRSFGPTDSLDVPGLAKYTIEGNLSPTFFGNAGVFSAETRFVLKFVLSETVLG